MKITWDNYPSDEIRYGDCSYKPSFPHACLKLPALANYAHPMGFPGGSVVKNQPPNTGDEGPQLAMMGESQGCSRAAATVCGFSLGTMARSVSLSRGAREVGSPCKWRGGARHCSWAMVGESGLETCWRRSLEVFLGLRQETLGSLDLCRWPQGASPGGSKKKRNRDIFLIPVKRQSFFFFLKRMKSKTLSCAHFTIYNLQTKQRG